MAADTKQMIADTLFEILEHKKIDAVTVKSLAEACGISRQTFYYHFQDILDVLEWGTRQALEQDVAESLRVRDLRAAIGVFVAQAVRRRAVIRMFLSSHRRADFERLLLDAVRVQLGELLRRRFPGSRLPVADAAALLDFCSYGVMGLLLSHCCREEADPEQLADQIYRLLTGQMRSALT